jgi:DNA uptake protein ComE-like DNA-binding protein
MTLQLATDDRTRVPPRRGLVLVLVLVVVAMLALSTYTFTSLMVTENEGSLLAGQQLQARALVDSGVAHVSYLLELEPLLRLDLGGVYENPDLFQAQLIADLGTDRSRARVGIVAPRLDAQGNLGGLRFGLQDESSRLNLNVMSLDLSGAVAAGLGGQASGQGGDNGGSDGSDGGNQAGAGGDDSGDGGDGSGNGDDGGGGGGDDGGGDESDGGEGDQGGPSSSGPNVDVSGRAILLRLPGMTVEIADAILDWIDPDGDPREYGAEADYYSSLSPPYTPQNGPLKTIEELLLVRGVTPDLLFGRDINRNGLIDVAEVEIPLLIDGDPGDGSMDFGWSAYLTLYSQEKNVNKDGLPRIDLNADDLQQLYDSLAAVMDADWATFIVAYRQYGPYQGEAEDVQPVSNVELDLTRPGATRINQVLDLIGTQVRTQGEGDSEAQTIASPFADGLAAMTSYLPQLMDLVTVNPAKVIPGRVNVNQAPRRVLLAVPGISQEIADAIISQRDVQNSEFDETMQHETWLLAQGIVTLDEMKTLLPFVTAGGDVYRAQIVGYFDDGEIGARAEVVFDATRAVPRILSWKDISHLGRGYPREVLGVILDDELARW